MKVFLRSIPFNYEHSVHCNYVNSHSATFPKQTKCLSRQDLLVKTYTLKKSHFTTIQLTSAWLSHSEHFRAYVQSSDPLRPSHRTCRARLEVARRLKCRVEEFD